MNIAVLYYSKTGNTKMLAEIACSEIKNNGHSVDLFNMDKNELPDCIQYDLVLLGSYCDSNSYPQIVRKILENLKCKKLGVFVTHATYEDGVYYEKWAKGCEAFYDNICKVRHIEKAGYFHCRSKPSGPIALFVKMVVIKDKEDWKKYKNDMNDYPREEEKSHFTEFVRAILNHLTTA